MEVRQDTSAMADRTTRLRAAIERIEAEFGREWLQWNSGLMPRRGQKSPTKNHPIATAWAVARNNLAALAEGKATESDPPEDVEGILVELARDLLVVRGVPHFETCVARLRDKDFEKAQYELHIAAVYKRDGRDVEFVSRAKGKRTADLKVLHDGQEVLVECTRKDSYQPGSANDKQMRVELQDRLLALQGEVSMSREVTAIVVGALSSRSASDILDEARRALSGGRDGVRINASQSIGLRIREPSTIPMPPGSIGGVVIPADMLSPNNEKGLAVSEGTVTADAQGNLSITGVKTAGVYVVDSHRMTSVVDSVREKFGQMPKGGSGLIYVDLDVSGVALGDLSFYMQMVNEAVKQALATPPPVSQLGAVVLTTGLVALPATNNRGESVTARVRLSLVVPNEAGSLPPGFRVADPWLFQKIDETDLGHPQQPAE